MVKNGKFSSKSIVKISNRKHWSVLEISCKCYLLFLSGFLICTYRVLNTKLHISLTFIMTIMGHGANRKVCFLFCFTILYIRCVYSRASNIKQKKLNCIQISKNTKIFKKFKIIYCLKKKNFKRKEKRGDWNPFLNNLDR